MYSHPRPKVDQIKTRPGTNATASTTRRSTRLLMSNGKQGQLKVGLVISLSIAQVLTACQHPPLIRDNRRTGRHRSRSVSDTEDTLGDALSPSSGSIAHSPRSDSTENLHAGSTSSQETKNNIAVADRYVFDLMKAFAKAQYHLSKYECKAALDCLDRLPQNQQMSPTAMITVAKAHYELVEYVPVSLTNRILSYSHLSVGRKGVQSCKTTRSLSTMGHGFIFNSTVASSKKCPTLVSRSRAA
jgi:hypothetical protein